MVSRKKKLPTRRAKPPVPVELDLIILSFMGLFTWELLQVPLFSSLADKGHVPSILICMQAALDDLRIALAALWASCVAGRDRDWAMQPWMVPVAVHFSTGLAVKTGFESLSTEVLDRWIYARDMPRLPLLGKDLSPLKPWLIIPSLLLWYLNLLSPRNDPSWGNRGPE